MEPQKPWLVDKVAYSRGHHDICPKAQYDIQESENSGNKASYNNWMS